MILTCEECSVRYIVPGQALGEEGRRVRCSNCRHVWFQKPAEEESEEPQEDLPPDEEEAEPIPESVIPDDDTGPVVTLDEKEGRTVDTARLAGYAAAFAVFVGVTGSLTVMQDRAAALWPATMIVYEMAGMKTAVDGENLIFDGLKAVAENNENGVPVLTVEANILNLSRGESRVPQVQTAMITEDGEVLDKWLTRPDNETVGPEGELPFITTYPEIPAETKEVNVRFVPGSRVSVAAIEPETGEAEEREEEKPAPEDSHAGH